MNAGITAIYGLLPVGKGKALVPTETEDIFLRMLLTSGKYLLAMAGLPAPRRHWSIGLSGLPLTMALLNGVFANVALR